MNNIEQGLNKIKVTNDAQIVVPEERLITDEQIALFVGVAVLLLASLYVQKKPTKETKIVADVEKQSSSFYTSKNISSQLI